MPTLTELADTIEKDRDYCHRHPWSCAVGIGLDLHKGEFASASDLCKAFALRYNLSIDDAEAIYWLHEPFYNGPFYANRYDDITGPEVAALLRAFKPTGAFHANQD